jgi:hypothetical protein
MGGLYGGDSERKIKELAALVQDDAQASYYQFRNGEETQPLEKQWSLIEKDLGQWTYQEVFNVFVSPGGNTHYSILEMRFVPKTIGQRFPILEYELVSNADSSWYGQPTVREGELIRQLDAKVDGKGHELFSLKGYAHQDDPEPGHIKFWSPEVGTVLIWFGEERYFELVDAASKKDRDLVEGLRKAAMEELKRREK